MQPRRVLLPLELTVFQVTKRGCSSTPGTRLVDCFLEPEPREDRAERREDLDVAEEVSVRGVEEIEGVEDDEGEEGEPLDGLEAARRLIAAGFRGDLGLSSYTSVMSASAESSSSSSSRILSPFASSVLLSYSRHNASTCRKPGEVLLSRLADRHSKQ